MSPLSDKLIYKLKAASIHLLISLFVFVFLLYFILFEWYPDPFFTAQGGWQGVRLMALVDLVLGPSLTFIIYSHIKSKKEIAFDLSLVAIVQIVALVWGGQQVYSERPVALVLWEGVFYPVTADYYALQDVDLEYLEQYRSGVLPVIYAAIDHSVLQLEEVQRLNLLKIPPYAQVHLYHALKENMAEIMAYQVSDEKLQEKAEWYEPKEGEHVFFGKAKYKNLLVMLDNRARLLDMKAMDF